MMKPETLSADRFHPRQPPSNAAPTNSPCSRSNSAMTSSVRGTQPSTTFCDLALRGSDTLVGYPRSVSHRASAG